MGSYAKGLKRRQEILDRAIEVFARRGAEGTSLRTIGEALGVSHAARRNRGVPGLVQLYSTLVAGALEDGHDEARTFFAARFADLRRVLAERVRAEQAAGRIRTDIAPEA